KNRTKSKFFLHEIDCGSEMCCTVCVWCPDCVTAEPIVRGQMSHFPEGSVFSIYLIFKCYGECCLWIADNS
uniref:Thioredoxin domain-containing protein n=1 Tax=Oryzias latipes TaxID=8090 RepID=A0A3P9MAH5_ORYLA